MKDAAPINKVKGFLQRSANSFKTAIPKTATTPQVPEVPTANVVKVAVDSIQTLQSEQAKKDLAGAVHKIRVILHGEGETPPDETRAPQVTVDAINQGLVLQIVNHLPDLEFETRKDAAQVVACLLKREVKGKLYTADLFNENPGLLDQLVDGYSDKKSALSCGLILREAIKNPDLNRTLLNSSTFYKFYDFVEVVDFDIASDAFATFRMLLTKNKPVASEFMIANYNEVFEVHYNKLVLSENYVTRRQSLKLLGEILLDRANVNVMLQYIASPDNLRLLMTMLKDDSKNIQYEAFHIFKVFVANPRKPPEVKEILSNNADKLLRYIPTLLVDKEDEHFMEEKKLLLAEIKNLNPSAQQPPAVAPTPAPPVAEPGSS